MKKELLLAFTTCALLAGCGEDKPEKKEEIVRLVRVEQVSSSGAGLDRSFSGSIKAGAETKLSFKVGGTLTGMKLKVGDKLEKGEVVAKLENREQSLQIEAAQARVDQAEAQLRNAQANNDRVRALYENNTATQAELDLARSSFDSSKAALAGAKKQLALAKEQAGNTVLRAPVSGVVAKVVAEDGENVGAGQAIAVVNSGKREEIEVAVPESLIGGVREGAACTVTIDALKGKKFSATVTEIGVSSGSTATTFPLVATFDEETKDVRPGMIARVSLAFGEANAEPKIRINPKAVSEDRDGRFVYIAKRTQGEFAQAKRLKVDVGEINSTGIHIKSGVTPGDLVITAGLTYLNEGKKVRLSKEFLGAKTAPNAQKEPSTEKPEEQQADQTAEAKKPPATKEAK